MILAAAGRAERFMDVEVVKPASVREGVEEEGVEVSGGR